MEATSGAPPDPSGDVAIDDVPVPARQRWRLILARDAGAPALARRELAEAWEVAMAASGLPFFRPIGRARGRVAFGAPIPATLAAEHELADIVLSETWPVWRVREALERRLPMGWRLLDVHDVWLGGPPLAGQVAAADYRIDLGETTGPAASAVAAAARTLLAAAALPRERAKAGSVVRYDLRPLLIDVHVAQAGPPLQIRTRTRFHPVLGTGRPEEVVAALGEAAGCPLAIGSMVRERIVLADELD